MKNFGDRGGCYPSEISIILHMIRKPNSVIVLLFIQTNFKFKNVATTCLPLSMLSSSSIAHVEDCSLIFIPCSLFPNAIFLSPGYKHFWLSVSCLVSGCGQNQNKTNLTKEILEISRSWTSVLMAATCGNRPKQNSVINNAQKDYKHRKILYLFETFSMIQLKCLVIPAGEE